MKYQKNIKHSITISHNPQLGKMVSFRNRSENKVANLKLFSRSIEKSYQRKNTVANQITSCFPQQPLLYNEWTVPSFFISDVPHFKPNWLFNWFDNYLSGVYHILLFSSATANTKILLDHNDYLFASRVEQIFKIGKNNEDFK